MAEAKPGRDSLRVADVLDALVEALWRAGRTRAPGTQQAAERAVAMRTRHQGPDHPDLARSLANSGRFLYANGDYEGARPLLERALAIREKRLGPDHPDVAASLTDLSSLLRAVGDYAGARPLLERALAIREKRLGLDHPDVASSLSALGGLLLGMKQYDEARPLLERALAIREKVLGPDHLDVAKSLLNLSYLIDAQSPGHADAKRLLERGLAIEEKVLGPEHPELFKILLNLGAWHYQNQDMPQAMRLYERALAINEKALGSDHPFSSRALMNLAMCYQDLHDYAAARPLMEQSLAILEKTSGPQSPDLAKALAYFGDLLRTLGDYAAARSCFTRALAIHEGAFGPKDPEVVSDMLDVADAARTQGDFGAARTLIDSALAIAQGPGFPDTAYVAQVLVNLELLLVDIGDTAAARPVAERVVALREKADGPDALSLAWPLQNLADLLVRAGDWREAVAPLERAVAIRQRTSLPDDGDLAQGLRALGGACLVLRDYAHAESLLTRAATIQELARLRAGHGLERAAFAWDPYVPLAVARLESGRAAEAWSATEQDLGRVLADLLISGSQRPLSRAEAAREDSLKRALARLEGERDALREASGRDTSAEVRARLEQAGIQLLATSADWRIFENQIAAKYPLEAGRGFPLERVQASLNVRTALLGWLDFPVWGEGDRSWGYVIRDRGPVTWVRLGPPPGDARSRSPQARARRFRQLVAEPGTPVGAGGGLARELWAERIRPLLPALEGAEELVVLSAHTAMSGIPLEALTDERGARLGDRFSISYAPSATVYAWLSERQRERAVPTTPRTLLVADPPFTPEQQQAMAAEPVTASILAAAVSPLDSATCRAALVGNERGLASLPRLPGTRAEVAALAAFAPTPAVLVGPAASEQALTRLAESDELRSFSVLHFATHALLDSERPERCCLVLSRVGLPDALQAAKTGQRVYDGRLTAAEILKEWRLDADLVTLSACETGLGRDFGGEGMVGLPFALLQAGARSVLVSLWKVDDRATGLLMKRFYENRWGHYRDRRAGQRGAPMPKAEALREAQRWLREYRDERGERPYEHPFYWAGFVLIGGRS